MAVKDAIVLNTTGSNFQAVQSGDTVRIKGDSTELLSIENSSETRVFSVGTSTTSVNIEGNVTSSKPISGSSTSTASFGHFVADTYEGDAREIAATLPRTGDIVSGSSQIAADVSGSFISGFNFGATADELYIGVSGSNSSHSASISGSSRGVSSGYVSGSDLSHLQVQQIGHIRGVVGLGTWSNVGSLITGRRALSTSGTTNATVGFGGCVPSTTTCTELWNGSTWSTANAMINTYHAGGSTGIGVQDAALRAAGFPSTYGSYCTDHWDGTNWSAGGAVIQRRFQTGNAGTVNAALLFGGRTYTPALTAQTCTEEYNGTSWSETGATGPAFPLFGGGGLQNAAFAFLYTDHDQYDGTTWSEAASLPVSKQQGAAAGTTNSTLTVGGLSGASLHYDGVSWCTATSLAQTQYQNAGNGTQGAALAIGGGTTPGTHLQCTAVYSAQQTTTGSFGRIEAGYVLGNAEDIKGQIPRDAGLVTSSAQLAVNISGSFDEGFNFGVTADDFYIGISGSLTAHSASISGSPAGQSASGSDYSFQLVDELGHIKGIVSAGTWTAGPNIGTPRQDLSAAGVQNATLLFGGYPTGATTELFNGSSWSELSNPNLNRGSAGGLGTVDAALMMGGQPTISCTELWNGTSWSEVTNMITARANNQGVGTQNAGLIFGGNPGITTTEEFNGTGWSTGGALITATFGAAGAGVQNAGLRIGGYGNAAVACVEHYDGSSWTAGGALIIARHYVKGAGTENSALVMGGPTATAEHYNGSSWTAGGNMNITRASLGGTGLSQAAIAAGGSPGSSEQEATELYDGNFLNTGSFGYVKAGFLKGDAGNIGASLASGSNIVSGSFQLAADISGSFISGFNFGATFEDRLIGVSGSAAATPGQSGSSALYSSSFTGHPSLMGVQLNSSGSDMSGSIYNAYGGEIKSGILGAWTAGTAISYSTTHASGTGTKDAFLIYGVTSAPNANTLEFDGSSWSSGGSTASGSSRGALFGTQNAGVATGRYPNDVSTKTEHYDGSSWSEGGVSPFQQTGVGTGTELAGMHFGGSPARNVTNIYSGKVWSSGPDMNTTHFAHSGAGTQYASIATNGPAYVGDPHNYQDGTTIETWDGTSWTVAGQQTRTIGYRGQGMGTVNDFLVAGNTQADRWDGNAWSVEASLSNQLYSAGGAGATGLSGIMAGGSPGTNTELWSGTFHGTGSFGRIESGYFTGDATSVSSTIFSETNTGFVSSSTQIASDVSGSFTSGFNFGALTSSFYDGVSGSLFSDLTSVSSSLSGSDFSPLLQYDVGHIRGKLASGVWSAGGALITARSVSQLATGTQNAALAGDIRGAPHNDTEEYNGTAWSATADMINARGLGAAAGTQNASFFAGGTTPGTYAVPTEFYNGISFANVASSNLNTGRQGIASAGTQNAGLVFGGTPSAPKQQTEEWNGTTWTEEGSSAYLSFGRYNIAGTGVQNAALAVGGQPSADAKVSTEHWNGTSWRVGGNLNTTLGHQRSAAGTENATWVAFGQAPAFSTHTEVYDGVAWTTTANAITTRGHGGGAGTGAVGLAAGGFSPGNLSCTEHWDGGFENTGSFGNVTASFITGDGSGLASTLPRSANIISGSPQIADDVSGSFVSGFNFGGTVESRFDGVSGSRFTPGVSGSSQFYSASFGHPSEFGDVSGSHPSGGADYSHLLDYEAGHIRGNIVNGVWSVGGSLITARRVFELMSGTQNAALAGNARGAPHNDTEEYNGATWAVAADMINGRGSGVAAGTQNASFFAGGYAAPTYSVPTEDYNGVSFSNIANSTLNTGRQALGGAGAQNAGLVFGAHPSAPKQQTEEWNGTTWSETSDLINGGCNIAGAGVQNAALATAGLSSTERKSITEHYDGTSWRVGGTMNIARHYVTSVGTENAAWSAFGQAPSNSTNTEIYDGAVWSTSGNAITARSAGGGAGTGAVGLAAGGYAPSELDSTVHFDGNFQNTGSFGRVEATYIQGDATEISSSLATAYSVKTSSSEMETDISGSFRSGIDLKGPITSHPIGAWRMVANSTNTRGGHAVIGDKECAISMADMGYGSPSTAEAQQSSEIFDGRSWRTGPNLPNAFKCPEAAGDVGSELLFRGVYSGSVYNATLRGDGTSFSQDAYMNILQPAAPAVKGGNIGTQNSALSIQMTYPSTTDHRTEEYDGMTWKIHPLQTNCAAGIAGAGEVNAAVATGGHGRGTCTELFDGTSWSNGPALPRGKCAHSQAGTQNDSITIGGATASPGTANTTYFKESELFNGTTWSSTPSIAANMHSRGDSGGGGSANSIQHGVFSSGRCTNVWDVYYPLSASFGRVEPKHGIITDRFELKGKHIDDNNTVFLLHSNTINDSVVFSGSMGDSSLSNHSMSFSGSVKHTSSFAQFGRTSIYFSGDGSLEVSGSGTANRDLEFGNDDFTIEYWVRQDAVQAAKTIFRKPGSYVLENETDVNNITFKFNESASISVGSNYTSSVDLWNHVAVVRHEDTLNMYINGKLRDTRADMTESMGSYGNSLFLGDADLREGTDTAFSGYIDEFRISNIARYNTGFVPEEGRIQRIASGSSPDTPFSAKKYEPATFKLPQFTNFDQPAILTQTLFQTNFSSSLSAISGSRTGRSGSGLYIKEENAGTVAGDMWFNRENNSLNFTFESSSYSGGAWSAGGDILTPYDNRGGGTGVPDAAVSFNAGGGAATSSINYDGAAWSLSGTMILARTTVGAAGTSQNAALAIGGYASPFDPGMCTETEAYDGMTWSEVADVITGRKHADGAGSQNAALFIGGYDVAASALSNKTEHFNGSAWSAGGALIIARQSHAAAGQQYAALAIGGGVPAVSTTVEEYNGSVWSAATAKITALGEGAGDGGVGSAIMAGSGTSPRGQTEEYNGVSWKAGPVLITGRQDLESASVGFASTGKGLVFGGRTPGATRATEEYTYSGVKSTLVVCALTGSQA